MMDSWEGLDSFLILRNLILERVIKMSKMSPNRPNRPLLLWTLISLPSANRPMPRWIAAKNQAVAERRIEFRAGSGEGKGGGWYAVKDPS